MPCLRCSETETIIQVKTLLGQRKRDSQMCGAGTVILCCPSVVSCSISSEKGPSLSCSTRLLIEYTHQTPSSTVFVACSEQYVCQVHMHRGKQFLCFMGQSYVTCSAVQCCLLRCLVRNVHAFRKVLQYLIYRSIYNYSRNLKHSVTMRYPEYPVLYYVPTYLMYLAGP